MAKAELDALITQEVKKMTEWNHQLSSSPNSGVGRRKDVNTEVHRGLNSKANRELLKRALGPAALKSWDEEPHLRYNLIKGVEDPPAFHISPEEGDAFMRLRVPGAPGRPYSHCDPGPNCLFSDVHVGQRKLLINEVLFMNLHGDKSNVVVYIGAAGGSHIPALCELFPRHVFLLYDPAQFSRPLMDYMRKYSSRISVYNELFPPAPGTRSRRELEKATSGETGFLLISDIRRRDENEEHPTNKDVMMDIDLQTEMCREMNPKAAHLKLRLAYLDPLAQPPEPDIEFQLPKGSIYFQPWCGHESTECRLIIEPPYTTDNTMTVSSRWYESALYYHNLVNRYGRYIVSVLEHLDMFVGTVYDACFDCSFERYTMWQYITTHNTENYRSFADLYNLFKKVIGREDERLLK